MKPSLLIAAFLASSLLSGCALSPGITIPATKPLMRSVIQSLYEESDPRIARTAMEANLKLLEGIIIAAPTDEELLVLAAQGYCGYSMLFAESEDPERAKRLYLHARDYGFRAMGEDWIVRAVNDDFDGFAGRVESLDRRQIGAAYWSAVAWGGWVNLSRSDPLALAQFPRVRKLMEWVASQDSNYFHSGPLWFFGVYYATLPPMLGGNPAESRRYFEQADRATGGAFQWGKVLYAKTYAVQQLDRDLFTRLLNEAATPLDNEPPELRLLNRVAAEAARRELTLIDSYF